MRPIILHVHENGTLNVERDTEKGYFHLEARGDQDRLRWVRRSAGADFKHRLAPEDFIRWMKAGGLKP